MTRFIFFSGKGGVGKTSMACATAVRCADEGKRTLIVTTDPASNLADVFEQSIGHQITPIAGVANLWAMEIDPDRATEEYKDRALAPIRAAFPPPIVKVMEEQMSGPCTSEVAAFDRFTDFLDAPAQNGNAFDVVIFDTAPTGHTIRLLELPAEWSQSIDAASQGSGQTCIGPSEQATTPFTRARRVMQEKYLAEIARRFPIPMLQIPLLPREVSGLEMLTELGQQVYGDGWTMPASIQTMIEASVSLPEENHQP